MSESAENLSDNPRSPKSPQSASWQWPTCNCSQEDLQALLPKATNDMRRPLIRRGATDTITIIARSKNTDTPHIARLVPESPVLTDSQLEAQSQSHDTEQNQAQFRYASDGRQLNVWKVSTLILLFVASAEAVWLCHANCTCPRSVHGNVSRADSIDLRNEVGVYEKGAVYRLTGEAVG